MDGSGGDGDDDGCVSMLLLMELVDFIVISFNVCSIKD
jgi:hypothetical protein